MLLQRNHPRCISLQGTADLVLFNYCSNRKPILCNYLLICMIVVSYSPSIKNEDGLTPFEVASSDEIRRAIEFEHLRQTEIVWFHDY